MSARLPAGQSGRESHAPVLERTAADYARLVCDAVLDERGFVRAVFRGRLRGRPVAWQRVVLRPVLVKDRPHIQFTYYDAARSVDKNLEAPAAAAELHALLRLPFRSVHVETTNRTLQITANRRGSFAVRSNAKKSPAARTLAHDRQKRLPLPPGRPDDYLVAVGIMAEDGRVRAERYDKFRQINDFVRLLGQLVSATDDQFQVRRIVDFGCGNAYLTFAVHHYFRNLRGQAVEMVGVDERERPLVAHRAKAAQLGWDGLTFVAGRIADFQPSHPPDLVLSLHACDTATDDALARAIEWKSRYVLSVPCCHHDLQVQLRAQSEVTPLRPIYRYGALAERLGDVLTDTLRALALRICGYRTDVVQFVSSEHSAKNLMIRAARAGQIADPATVAEYVRLRDFLQVTPFLERRLGGEFQTKLAGTAGPSG